jgi:hypothetical protein
MFPFERLSEMLEASSKAIKENTIFSDVDRDISASTTPSRRLSTEGFMGLFSPKREPAKEFSRDMGLNASTAGSLIEASPISASLDGNSTGSLIDFEDLPKLKGKFTGIYQDHQFHSHI